MGCHRYRHWRPSTNGVTFVPKTGKYRAQMRLMGDRVTIGAFDTPERAQIAFRLYRYWVLKGHHPDTIPRQPRTRDAI